MIHWITSFHHWDRVGFFALGWILCYMNECYRSWKFWYH